MIPLLGQWNVYQKSMQHGLVGLMMKARRQSPLLIHVIFIVSPTATMFIITAFIPIMDW
jgi:hypothetical protein